MKEIIEQRAHLFDITKPRILDRITSTKRRVRERAVGALTKPLSKDSDKDIAIFQTIPLEFLTRGDVIGAIWFIETT